MGGAEPTGRDDLRGRAIKRVKAKHDFRFHLCGYLAVNQFLLVLWAITGGITTAAGSVTAFFWPAIPIVVWGIVLGFHWYRVYYVRTFSEADIEREMDRLQVGG